jgi:hypothetical protein
MRDILTLLLIVLLCAACHSVAVDTTMESQLATAQTPVSVGYPLSTQSKMQAMHHWDQLAERVAAQGSQAFTHFFPNAEIGVYVAPAGTTPFAKVYREALITHLVAYGVPVSFSPEGNVILEITTEMVNHSRQLVQTDSGAFRTLEPGFTQRKNERGRFLPVPLVAGESGYFGNDTPNAEIQITTSLAHHDAYIYRDSSIFYVNDAEWRHYQARAPKGSVELKRYSLGSK